MGGRRRRKPQWNRVVTELLQSCYQCHFGLRVDRHDLRIAVALKLPGLVKSPSLVVESVGRSERDEYCGLVLALSVSSRAPEWRLRHRVGH
jgi:hypothetical protein